MGVEAEQVLAASHLDAAVAGVRGMFRRGLVDHFDARVGVGVDDGLGDLQRAVGRALVHDDKLYIGMGLRDDALHRFGQKRVVVAADDHHRNSHSPSNRPVGPALESARF